MLGLCLFFPLHQECLFLHLAEAFSVLENHFIDCHKCPTSSLDQRSLCDTLLRPTQSNSPVLSQIARAWV